MSSYRALGAYAKHSSDPIEERVMAHAPLVRRLAYHLVGKLPASVEVDDLIQAGLIGLMDAARMFDPAAGVQFETYASQRIKGAMLDELREADWLPRSLRRNMREIESSIAKLEQQFGRSPSELEIATQLGTSLADYQSLLADCRGHQLVYYDEHDDEDNERAGLDQIAVDEGSNPLQNLDDADFRRVLIGAIDGLPEREKLLMALYYDEELNLKEIGAVLGVTESRVSQLHSQAIARLRVHLRDWVHK